MDTTLASAGRAAPSRSAVIFALARGPLALWLPVFLACGMGLYASLRFEPPPALYWPLLLFGLALPFACRAWPLLLPLAWMLGTGCAGFAIAGLQAHRVAAPVLSYRYYGAVEGRVVGLDRSQAGALRVTLSEVRILRLAPQERPKRVRVSLYGEGGHTPQPGELVGLTAHLSPPTGPVEPGGFDFQRHAWFQQLGAVGYSRVPMVLLAPAPRGPSLFKLRMQISSAIKARMPAREGAFAAAILTGDRSDIDQAALEALRISNLAHLLAISGLHMGLLTGVIFALVRFGLALMPSVAMRLPAKKIAALCALVVGAGYLAVSGANVATQRAFVMVAVMLIAVCLDRRAITLRAVAIAGLIVLMIRPDSLTGPGFQMSFAATTALVAVFAWLRDREVMAALPRWARGAASLVISSAVAGVATAPFAAAHFNQFAQFGLVANLSSVPVMGLVVMPGAVLAAVLTPLGLEEAGLWVMGQGLRWILFVAETVSGWEGARRMVVAPPALVLPLLGLGGAALCLLPGWWRGAGGAVILVSLALWSQAERPAVLVSGDGGLIGVMTPEGRAMNKARGSGFAASVWLENDGDPDTQDEVAARAGMARNQGRLSVGASVLRYDLKADGARCEGAALVILPAAAEPPEGCLAMTEASLREGGSVAVYVAPDGLRLITANALRGARLWAR